MENLSLFLSSTYDVNKVELFKRFTVFKMILGDNFFSEYLRCHKNPYRRYVIKDR